MRLVERILRHHPRLGDRQIVWVAEHFQAKPHHILKARRELAEKARIRCLARSNARGQLVKVWELTN